ncbi:MAG: PDDEXK nuclease domain-containing protein [bacterium]|nr:DUF1016 family protein [bacterium]
MKTGIETLLLEVRSLILSARKVASRNINTIQVITNFRIGLLIVEHEQKGKERADYGKKVLSELSKRLTVEFGRGFSQSNLEYMRKFYLMYREEKNRISQTVFGKSLMKTESSVADQSKIQLSLPEMDNIFTLSWSHYLFLMNIKDTKERSFYEIEATQNNWSLSELKRQFDTSLYERLALSRKKGSVKLLSEKGQVIEKPQDILKSPYVLEFLGIDEKAVYSETDLENAIINKIEHFLLELGKGFLFEARQKRFTFESEHFFVDLVFYNRLLRAYVLIDLKIGKLTHKDLGQMQMYVNYYDRNVKISDEHPTVGIILCKMKNNAIVELTLPENAKVYASEYQLYLPSKEELKQKLIEWSEEKNENVSCV